MCRNTKEAFEQINSEIKKFEYAGKECMFDAFLVNLRLLGYAIGGILMKHNKTSFTAEYCRCRAIPYRIKGEALFINKIQVCFSLFNLTYTEIISMIDKFCVFDKLTQNYVRVS